MEKGSCGVSRCLVMALAAIDDETSIMLYLLCISRASP
jgi:hypothetical protein